MFSVQKDHAFHLQLQERRRRSSVGEKANATAATEFNRRWDLEPSEIQIS
jgi:hypothetical protein